MTARRAPAVETGYGGQPGRAIARELAAEAPVAIEVNGLGYAVMMATPADLEDFAVGFALSDGLVSTPAGIEAMAIAPVAGGWIVRLTLPAHGAAPLLERARLRLVEGSCGLCGLESIEQVLRPLPPLGRAAPTTPGAIAAALAGLAARQDANARTGAMHAAAFCRTDGTIAALREDIGRHNALDKLIGAQARGGADMASGFVLVSARCSFELVEKTVRAGCPMLVAISAPTTLAVERARAAGLTLAALARDDTMLVFNDPGAMLGEVRDGL